jgi:hypothetical protein
MDEMSRKLLNSLRAKRPMDLDDDERETMLLLEEQERKSQGKKATVEEALRAGEGRAARKPRECPKCGSKNYSGRSTQFKVAHRCKDCGNKWDAPPIPAYPAGPRNHPRQPLLPTAGPFTKPSGGEEKIQPSGRGYFRNPKKVR